MYQVPIFLLISISQEVRAHFQLKETSLFSLTSPVRNLAGFRLEDETFAPQRGASVFFENADCVATLCRERTILADAVRK